MAINIETVTEKYTVGKLSEEHLPAVLTLYDGNPLYTFYCPPKPSLISLKQDLVDLPPGKSIEDKYFLGYWQQEELVAIVDIISGYPEAGTAYIGLFMVDAAYQGRGLGSQLVDDLLACLAKDFKAVRLGFIKGNPQAQHFWLKNGFQVVKEVEEPDRTVVVAEKHLN